MSELHLLLDAKDGFTEPDGEFQAEIISLSRATAPLAATPHSTTAKPTEKRFEKISKPAHVTHVGHAAATQASLSKLVVALTGLRIAQDLVGPPNFLEALLCAWISVDIGMVLTCQATIGTLEGVRIGITTHSQHLVEVRHQPAFS
jgi:hypothetical protein